MNLPSGSAPLPGPSKLPGNLHARPSRRESPSSGPFLTGSPPPLVLAVRILALRHSLPGNRTVPTSGTQRARPLPPAPSRTHFGTPLWLPPIPPTRSLQVSPALVRSFSSTARNRFENRVAEKQKLFQVGGGGAGRGEDPGRGGGGGGSLRSSRRPLLIRRPQLQADNDLPVHLKGGATDNILYRVTMGLCLGGECGAGAA